MLQLLIDAAYMLLLPLVCVSVVLTVFLFPMIHAEAHTATRWETFRLLLCVLRFNVLLCMLPAAVAALLFACAVLECIDKLARFRILYLLTRPLYWAAMFVGHTVEYMWKCLSEPY
jgi:hypothetical protein